MFLFIVFFIDFNWAQNESKVLDLTSDTVTILSNPKLLNNQSFQNISTLENQFYQSKNENLSCESLPLPEENQCQHLTSSDLPKNLKDQNFRVLFEVKYQPIVHTPSYTGTFDDSSFTMAYSESTDVPDGQIPSFENFAQIKSFSLANVDLENQNEEMNRYVAFSFLIRDLQKTKNYEEMMDRFQHLSADMNETEKIQFLAAIGSFVDYNYDRAAFIQEEGAGLGRVGPFEQLIGTQSGICGDIASMTAKFAENLGYEAFTIGYSLEDNQHIVTGVVDKKTKKFTVLNYGAYAEAQLDDNNSNPVLYKNPDVFPGNSSIQYRIFKNSNEGEDGKMQSIASIPTELGTFMSDLFYKQKEFKRVMPGNENYTKETVTFSYDQNKVKENNNGDIIQKSIGDGIIVYEGKTSDAQIYGVAINHHVFKELFAYDPQTQKCVKKKSGYFSLGVANSLVGGFMNEQLEKIDTYHVYLNMRGGKIWHFIDSEYFKFQGIIGYEFDGFASFHQGQFYTADVNLKSFVGLMAEYQKKNTNIQFAIRSEQFVGLRDQNLMTDFSTIPTNVNPMSFNAVSLDANLRQKISPEVSLISENNLTLSRVGGRLLFSVGVLTPKSSVMVRYQDGFNGYQLGNNLQNINLTPTLNGRTDGVYVDYNRYFSNRKKTFSGNAGVYVGGGFTSTGMVPNVGGSLKINLNKR
jgi:hypothetical protein